MSTLDFVKREIKKDCGTLNSRLLREHWGVRYKNVSDDGSEVEIGTTYFYKKQQETTGLFLRLRETARAEGLDLLVSNHGQAQEIPEDGQGLDRFLRYDRKAWPKDSFATLVVKLVEAEGDD